MREKNKNVAYEPGALRINSSTPMGKIRAIATITFVFTVQNDPVQCIRKTNARFICAFPVSRCGRRGNMESVATMTRAARAKFFRQINGLLFFLRLFDDELFCFVLPRYVIYLLDCSDEQEHLRAFQLFRLNYNE